MALAPALGARRVLFRLAAGLDTGRTLAFQGGLRLEPALGRAGNLWIDGNAGLVLTGDERRFGFDAGLGFEFRAADWFGVGPFARYHHVLHDAEVNAPSDAIALTFGVSFTLRIPGAPPPPPPTDRDHDGVLDPDDACVDVPQGPNPDPARRGCPRPDADGDGVFDDEDQCPREPQGEHPDPARRGCPDGDTDGDGVLNSADQCVDVPQGEHHDPARRGCPDGDTDSDGVLNSADQCPQEPQGLTPDPQRAGCPAPDRDRDTVTDPTDRCPDEPGDPARQGCPGIVVIGSGTIRILQPVYFATDRDVILPRSFPVLEAVRGALAATPAIRRIAVDGHTDDANTDEYNLDLSRRRATSVVRWLTEHDIAPSRLEARGFGESRPIQAIAGLRRRALRTARAANRRVEFVILDPAPPSSSPTATTPAPRTLIGTAPPLSA